MTDLHTLQVESHGAYVVATLRGEIDASNADVVGDTLTQVGADLVVLDVTGVSYLDSAGIAMVDRVQQATELRLVLDERSVIARTLDVSGMSQLIDTYASVEQATSDRPLRRVQGLEPSN